MDYQQIFSESVQKHFASLIDDFGFSMVENEYLQSSATCAVAFQNKARHIKLHWGLKDQEFYFGVYRVFSNGKPAPYQDHGTNHFYISTLAELYEYPHINIRFLVEMDREEPDWLHLLDEKISANAKLLQKYGKDILAGRQWFDQIQNTLIPEGALTGTRRELKNTNREVQLAIEGINQKAAGNFVAGDRRPTITGRPSDSNKPLPMWLALLIVGSIALGIVAALIAVFWSLLQ